MTSAPRSHCWVGGRRLRAHQLRDARAAPARENRRTGATLNSRPLAIAIITVVASTRRSTAMAATRGTSAGMTDAKRLHGQPRAERAERGPSERQQEALREQCARRDPSARRRSPTG